MEGLQRSGVSVRRQGSSGYVWDDKFLGELFQAVNQKQEQPQRDNQENTSSIEVKPVSRTVNTIESSRSNGGGQRGYRAERVSPAIEPPSPKVSACGLCAAFGKQGKGHRKKVGKGRSR